MRIWELVATMPGIEGASTDYIAQFLVPRPPTTPSTSPTPIAITTFSSKGSNFIAVVAQDNDDDEE